MNIDMYLYCLTRDEEVMGSISTRGKIFIFYFTFYVTKQHKAWR